MTAAYLQIFVAALFFACQFVFSKLFQRHSDGSLQANLWMAVLHGAWMLVVFWPAAGFTLPAGGRAVGFALGYAAASVACTLASVRAVSLGRMVTVTLYSMVGGQAVPFVYGLLFTGARPTVLTWLGFALIVAAALPAALPVRGAPAPVQGTNGAPGAGRLFLPLCMVVFFANGLVSVFSDANAKAPDGAPPSAFLVLCALWLLALGLPLLLVPAALRRAQGRRGTLLGGLHAPGGRSVSAGRLLAAVAGITGAYTLLNGLGNVFSLRAAAVPGMQPSVQFPLLNACIMLLTPLLGYLVFGERPTRRDWAAMALLVGGILLFMASFLVYGR